ncbi:MAG: HAMP domain-containing sensor histidine kinase, partial [Planktotalea sp.]|uniref:sensor histidine kinase n=1 Tax=Planktotalea sp. TaxID=2029877 RepID=UPI003C78A20F
PIEARGLVRTLNTLFDRVARRISSKDEFISNAAHQLRNPVAGVLALAEAVQSAPNETAARKRSAELVDAARQASELTNQLLSFERASGTDVARAGAIIDLRALTEEIGDDFRARHAANDVTLSCELPGSGVIVHGDPVMLREAILNLLTNALLHGGPQLTSISLALSKDVSFATLHVKDDGVGIRPDRRVEAISRFGQIGTGPGSGLGLAIAAKVMKNHDGTLDIGESAEGGLIILTLPLAKGTVS